jgi:deoxycytidylate deaminase
MQNNIVDRWRHMVEQKNEDEDKDEDELVHVLTASPPAHSPAAHHQHQVEDAAEHCNMYTTSSPCDHCQHHSNVPPKDAKHKSKPNPRYMY